jgi:hypothetical protein
MHFSEISTFFYYNIFSLRQYLFDMQINLIKQKFYSVHADNRFQTILSFKVKS